MNMLNEHVITKIYTFLDECHDAIPFKEFYNMCKEKYNIQIPNNILKTGISVYFFTQWVNIYPNLYRMHINNYNGTMEKIIEKIPEYVALSITYLSIEKYTFYNEHIKLLNKFKNLKHLDLSYNYIDGTIELKHENLKYIDITMTDISS